MWIATKLGTYSIVQIQPPDDGDAAVYELSAQERTELESLLQATGLRREIITQTGPPRHESVIVTQQEVFEIMSTLSETIDYDHFETPDSSR